MSIPSSGVNLSYYQGDTFTTLLYVKDSNGNAVDLNNYSGYSPVFYRYGNCSPNYQLYVSVYEPTSGILQLTSYGASTTGIPAGRLNYQVRLYSSYNSSFVSHFGYLDLSPGDISMGTYGGSTGSTSGDYAYSQKINVETGVYYQAVVFPSQFNYIPCAYTQLEVPNIDGMSWYFVGVSGASSTGLYLTYGTQVLETGYKVNLLVQNCSNF